MSSEPDPGTGKRLDLSNMPENFHPAATWTRLVVFAMILSFIGIMKPLAYYLYGIIGEIVIFWIYLLVILYVVLFITVYCLRLERWFPRPSSTKSWSSRTAIGWNLHLCEIEGMGFKGLFRRKRDNNSILFLILFILYMVAGNFSHWMIFLAIPFLSGALAFFLGDRMRLLADTTAKSDPRVAALIY